jgi:hypothetical protein
LFPNRTRFPRTQHKPELPSCAGLLAPLQSDFGITGFKLRFHGLNNRRRAHIKRSAQLKDDPDGRLIVTVQRLWQQ